MMYNNIVLNQSEEALLMIAERLKLARKRQKITQEKLAELANTTKSTISNYENSYSSPSADMILTLAEVLNTTTDYLLGRTDQPDIENAEKKYNSIDEIVKDKDMHQWLFDLIEKNPESLERIKKLSEVLQEEHKKEK